MDKILLEIDDLIECQERLRNEQEYDEIRSMVNEEKRQKTNTSSIIYDLVEQVYEYKQSYSAAYFSGSPVCGVCNYILPIVTAMKQQRSERRIGERPV